MITHVLRIVRMMLHWSNNNISILLYLGSRSICEINNARTADPHPSLTWNDLNRIRFRARSDYGSGFSDFFSRRSNSVRSSIYDLEGSSRKIILYFWGKMCSIWPRRTSLSATLVLFQLIHLSASKYILVVKISCIYSKNSLFLIYQINSSILFKVSRGINGITIYS